MYWTIKNRHIPVKIYGIYCPQKGQPFYNEARDYTASFIFNEEVQVKIIGVDNKKRIVGVISSHGYDDIAKLLLLKGLAWHDRENDDTFIYSYAEQEARTLGRGMWAKKEPLPPKKQPDKAVHASPAKPRHGTSRDSRGTVLVCSDRGTSAYHRTSDCRALSNCRSKVNKMSKAEAERTGCKPCANCHR